MCQTQNAGLPSRRLFDSCRNDILAEFPELNTEQFVQEIDSVFQLPLQFDKTLFVRYVFNLPVSKDEQRVTLSGVVDQINAHDDETVECIDYTTHDESMAIDSFQNDPYTVALMCGARQVFFDQPVTFTRVHIPSGRTISTPVAEVEELLRSVVAPAAMRVAAERMA